VGCVLVELFGLCTIGKNLTVVLNIGFEKKLTVVLNIGFEKKLTVVLNLSFEKKLTVVLNMIEILTVVLNIERPLTADCKGELPPPW
jgi:hypothetical protein